MISLPAAFTFRIAGAFLKKYWRVAVVLLLVGAIAFFAWSYRERGERISELETDLAKQTELTQEWKDASELQTEKALLAAAERDVFEKKLEKELAKPPKVIVKWKEVEPTVGETVTSAADCESGVADLGRLIKKKTEDLR